MNIKHGENIIKQFGMSNMLIESELLKLESENGINLGRKHKKSSYDVDLYDHFQQSIRSQAEKMASYYAIFYCLENSIRDLIIDVLTEHEGNNWWQACVSQQVRQEVEKRIRREVEEGVTNRSDIPLYYTNFGELAEIIVKNWQHFDDILSDKIAVTRVISRLNTVRGPIAHCCILPEDEVDRLILNMKDWFRLMA